MVLPNKEIVQDIRNLINEITGFGEDEENFYICEQYCLSHVMHHSYPSVNKNEVKRLIDGYILRFFIHGHFKVADGLDLEVKNFLSCDNLFKKNPEFDIQWILLGLLTSLASNLTEVTKLPKMMPLVEEEKPIEEINWGEYLKEGLPNYEYSHSDEDSSSDEFSCHSESLDPFAECEETTPKEPDKKMNGQSEACEADEVSSIKTFHPSRQHIIDELVKRREEEISYARDIVLRGNFIEDIGFFIDSRLSWQTSQILSEFELVGYILKQFLSGENVFKKKGITNPATCSLTQDTVKNYLTAIQPYVNMITVFKEFINEVSHLENGNVEASHEGFSERSPKPLNMYSNLNKLNVGQKKTVPNVIKLYNLALTEALNLFENKILTMSEYQNSYTLVKVLNELRPSFNDLNSLFAVHLAATANWLNEPNWLCSVRIIMALYKAVLHSTSNRLGFLYMNMFLYCFQAYLDITDSWISCLHLKDPHDEFIIYRTEEPDDSGSGRYTYSVRPYKEELTRVGLKQIEILDYLADEMLQVGHSIDVLHRLDRSLIKEHKESNFGSRHENLYKKLLNNVKIELKRLEEVAELKEEAVYEAAVSTNDESGDSNNNTNNVISKESFELIPVEAVGISTSKQIALNEFCTKLCEYDRSDYIEKSIWPLCVIMDKNIKNLINLRVMNTCDIVKDVVLNEFQLKTHLRLLRNIYLFNESYLIQPFINALFSQELLWRNSYVLTPHLRECIESRYKDLVQYFAVVMEDDSGNPPENVLQAINRITINYQVDWPLQLIFTPRIMKLYNNIFRHLLKIHWAHETLCKLQFKYNSNEVPEIVKSSNRRLELLRFWCLSSLARLRSYFMTQISIPFDLKLSSYQHLKHIIEAHEEFIEKIHSRCLLDEKNLEGRELIYNILIPLCHDVYRFWSAKGAIPDSKLSFIENLFFTSQKRFTQLIAGLEDE